MHLLEMSRHLEDLYNRGRRCNIRIRGLPKSVSPAQLEAVFLTIFNELLDRPPDSPVGFERCHRASRPRASQDSHPRDVLCCLESFKLKEDILRGVRDLIRYGKTPVQLYQDLAYYHLTKGRGALHSLLHPLRERGDRVQVMLPILPVSHSGGAHLRVGSTSFLQGPAYPLSGVHRLAHLRVPVGKWQQP